MGKGLRSKYKRRIRSVRRQHYWEIEGKEKLQEISNKLHDPTYDFSKDGSLPANAFLEPHNPNAVFPQHAKPHILDFRSHKMASSGFASIGNFRKMMSSRSKKSKYAAVNMTPEQLEAQRIQEEMMKEMQQNEKEESDSDVDIADVKKAPTVDDIMNGLDKQMKLAKKKKGEAVPITKKIYKPGERIAELKKKSKGKRSRKQLMF